MPDDRTQFASRAVAHVASDLDPDMNRWFTQEQLKSNLHTSLGVDLERTHDSKFGERFSQGCPVEGASPGDYMNRFAAYSGGTALLGIRFKGLDLSKPFVDVVATTSPITDAQQIQELCRLALREYTLFNPTAVRFVVISRGAMPAFSCIGTWEKKYLIGSIAEMAARPAPAHTERVELKRSEDLSFFDVYLETYTQLLASNPQHHEYATVEEREDLESCLENGAVFEVHIDGHWAGLFSGHTSVDACLNGFLVTENLLTNDYRGHGLGPAVQWHAANHLAPNHRVLFGTIHKDNQGAYRTALKSGRIDVGGYCWVFV